MWCRVSSGQVPIRIVSARRRTSTASSATRRWPRTMRSSAHSLLPMPLSPTMSTPRPRMSSSTPCSSSRATKLSSSMADDLGHGDGRRHCRAQHRQTAPLGLEDHLAERFQPASDEDARHLVVLAHLAHRIGAVRGVEAFQVADLAVAEDEDAPFAQILVKPRERKAGFLDVGTQDAAIEAAAAGKKLEIQPQRFGTALKKLADRHASCCAHRRLAGPPRAARLAAVMLVAAIAERAPAPRAAVFGRMPRCASVLPLALDRFCLLEHFPDCRGERCAPRRGGADAGQNVILPRVDDDFRHEAVFLLRQHHLHRDQRVAEAALQLLQPGVDESSERGRNFYLPAGEQ